MNHSRLHLAYLDGIRGLAAFYVMQYHALTYVQFDDKAQGLGAEMAFLFSQGHFAVVIFIVLSGYCLMLPCVKNGAIRGGFRSFIFRRARRLLPPYYAALALCALLLAVAVGLGMRPAAEAFNLRAWITHGLLVHNLDPRTILEINGPLWSVATEWQIYFFFPLLLLPVWRWAGNTATVATAVGVGLLLAVVFPSIRAACPWFIALFAMGMAAASLNFSAGAERLRKWPLGWAALLGGVATFVMIWLNPTWVLQQDLEIPPLVTSVPDLVAGLATACLLIRCTRDLQLERPSLLLKLLACGPLVFLGGFSYSLYLIHSPIQSGFAAVLWKLKAGFVSSEPALLAVLLAVSLGAGWLFYLLFERPFLNVGRPTEPVSAVSPLENVQKSTSVS